MDIHSGRPNGVVRVSNALVFMAADRETVEEAYPGDIIGLHNHGTISIGDSFSEGEVLNFTSIPNFAPELLRRVVLKDPLKAQQLNNVLDQLSEGGAPQVYRPTLSKKIIPRAFGRPNV